MTTQKTVRLSSEYSINKNGELVVTETGYDSNGEFVFHDEISAYKVGKCGVLKSRTDVSPNAIREGRDIPQYSFILGIDGIPCNADTSIKKINGWCGTTSNSSINAHGIYKIKKIKQLKSGLIALVLTSVDDHTI